MQEKGLADMTDSTNLETVPDVNVDQPMVRGEEAGALRVREYERVTELKACVLCGARDARRVYMQAYFPVVRCKSCGLLYADEHFSEVDLEGFYSGNYYERAYVLHPKEIDQKLARDYAQLIERVISGRKEGKLLDFGSARGSFLAELIVRGHAENWDLLGIDINPDEIRLGEEAGLPVMCSELFAAEFEDETFDVVTAFSVIEHMQDPMGTLKELARVLKPGGNLVVIVPNGDCLLVRLAIIAGQLSRRLFRSFTDKVFHEEHFYYFTKKTFASMCYDVGLIPQAIFGAPSYLEVHPTSPWVALGAYGVRFASFILRRQTMLVAIVSKPPEPEVDIEEPTPLEERVPLSPR
jgi:2-polyprenyl-3-methyl-5-hydroxy-6-metoxy-1,4-benzoquinol methylase